MASANVIAKSSHSTNARSYFSKISAMPYLEADQEAELAKRFAETGDEKAKEALVNSHLRLVVSMAMNLEKFGFDAMDLISVGSMGLMKAIDRFDPSKGFKLATYARWWIKASMNEFMLENRSLVRITSTALNKKLVMVLGKHKAAIANGNAERIFNKIAKDLNTTSDYVANIYMLTCGIQSMHRPAKKDGEDGSEIGDFFMDQAPLQDEVVEDFDERSSQADLLKSALRCLNEREAYIFRYRRLLDEDEQKTLEELAQEIGVSRERIRQIEVRSFEKVQAEAKKIAAAKELARMAANPAAEPKTSIDVAGSPRFKSYVPPVRKSTQNKRTKNWNLVDVAGEKKLVCTAPAGAAKAVEESNSAPKTWKLRVVGGTEKLVYA